MRSDAPRGYRFATEEQWNACLFEGVDRDATGKRNEVRPFAPYAGPGELHRSAGAAAPAVTRLGELLWHDDAGTLYRLRDEDETPQLSPSPSTIGRAKRIAADANALWAAAASPARLEAYELETLTRLIVVELADVEIADIAGDGRDGVFVLVRGERGWKVEHVDCAGRIEGSVALDGICDATAFVYLSRSQRFVVLARCCDCREQRGQQRLYWFDAKGGAPSFSLLVATLRPCFSADALGSDGRSRVVLAGVDAVARDQSYVLSLDADGNLLSEVAVDAGDTPVRGIAAGRTTLLVAGPRGLVRFAAADAVPEEAGEARCTLLTPMLDSPDREDARRWLRIEAMASLPPGSTIEIAFAAPKDAEEAEVRRRMLAVAADQSLPASHRLRRLLAEPDVWREATVFHGGTAQTGGSAAPHSAPLFDVRERSLWAAVTLRAAPGAKLPSLSQLAVLYPGRTLMEHLPAIYQRAEAQPGSFLRALVGVLEAQTQEIDGRIATMARSIHPQTAPPDWLDYVARWLGLPWDDGLDPKQKQALVKAAPDLANGRGTRAGLEALLAALIPGLPRRFRVTDATADRGFAIVGGAACVGSALPALLAGTVPTSAELGVARIGSMRLRCAGQAADDTAGWLARRVLVEVAASGRERAAWEPWLYRLLAEMVPVTARLELRWVSAYALRDDRLDGMLILDDEAPALLGSGAVTGRARLPERGARLSPGGLRAGTRLQ